MAAAGGAGRGVAAFLVKSFGLRRPCGRAATRLSAVPTVDDAPIQVLRQSVEHVMRQRRVQQFSEGRWKCLRLSSSTVCSWRTETEIPQVQLLDRSFRSSGQYIDNVVNVPVVMRRHFFCTGGLRRLVEEFEIYFSTCPRSSHRISWTFLTSSSYLADTGPVFMRPTRGFLKNFRHFLR